MAQNQKLAKQLETREAKISELVSSKNRGGVGMGNANAVSPIRDLDRSMDLRHQLLSVTSSSGPELSFTPSSTDQHLRQIDFLSSQVAAYEKKLKASESRLKQVEKERMEHLAQTEKER